MNITLLVAEIRDGRARGERERSERSDRKGGKLKSCYCLFVFKCVLIRTLFSMSFFCMVGIWWDSNQGP